MNEHIEEWRPTAVNPWYDVSSWGRIRSKRNGKILSKTHRPNGAMEALLYSGSGKSDRYSVAWLVWNAFRDPVPKGTHFKHINGDPADDRIENLEVKKMKLTKEEFLAGMAAAKEVKEEAPGPVAAEIEADLKRERASQTPVKQTVQIPKVNDAARIETPENAIKVTAPERLLALSGRIEGPIEQGVTVEARWTK